MHQHDHSAPRLRRRGREGIGLALRDLAHDRRTTLVLLVTVAAIVAPVMLLFGLKHGIVTTMIEKFLKEPSNLEITVYGNFALDHAWFERYAKRPDLRFMVPNTRTISATIDLVAAPERAQAAVEMIPTAAGDPLLRPAAPPPQPGFIARWLDDRSPPAAKDRRAPAPGFDPPADPDQLLLTATLAAKLRLAPGDPVTGFVRRGSSDSPEPAQRLDLRVTGIIPEDRFAGDALFCQLALLVATEDYRDGLRPTLETAQLSATPAAARTHFANARVYAADLDGVETLAAAMRADGIEIRTQAEKIRSLRALADTLAFVFQVVALIGTLGGVLALGGALWVNIDRKRRSLALLRLYGFGNLTVVLVPLAQSLAIAAGGFVLAYGGYLAGAAAFNQVLGTNLAGQGFVCRLEPTHLLAALGLTLAVALLAASAAGYRASRIDAAECLRET